MAAVGVFREKCVAYKIGLLGDWTAGELKYTARAFSWALSVKCPKRNQEKIPFMGKIEIKTRMNCSSTFSRGCLERPLQQEVSRKRVVVLVDVTPFGAWWVRGPRLFSKRSAFAGDCFWAFVI